MTKQKKTEIAKTIVNIMVPIVTVVAFLGIVYTLVAYDSNLNVFFDSPLNLIFAISLIVVFSVLIVVISLLNSADTSETDNSEKAKTSDVSQTENERGSETVDSRFSKLTIIDAQMEKYKKPSYTENLTLKELCDGFRNYAAYQHGLYYDYPTIRSFISGLAVNKLLIMQGISGTGKTSMAWVFGEYIGHPSDIIPVQPSWKERTDLLGYFNEFTRNYNETEFLRGLYEASYTDDVCVTVLDEMNIARVEYYFAEFLSLLEIRQTDSWMIDVVPSVWSNDPKKIVNGRFKVPQNMWYIGTANNDDSTMAISDKVYDRAMVIDLNSRASAFEAAPTTAIKLSYSGFMKLVKDAWDQYSLSDELKKKIAELDKYLIEHLGITFGNRIMRQMETFVPVFISCGGTETEAIDILVARKVLRKLEAKNPLLVKRQVEDMVYFINELFGSNEMKLCKEVICKFDI